MYIQTLQVFCDLAESGSFSKAAAANGVSQSAVSQQIRSAEKELAVVLVERRRSGLALTAEGQVFLKMCREMLEIYSRLPGQLAAVDVGATGEIRISAVFSIGLYELPSRLRRFRESHTGVRVKVDYKRASQVYASVLDGTADLGFVAYPSRRTGIHVEVFDEDELVLICPPQHPLAEREVVGIQDLEGQRMIAFKPDVPTRRAIDRSMRQAGLRLAPYLEFDSVETVKRAVKVEDGVSIVPHKAVLEDVASKMLVARDISGMKMTRPLGLIYKQVGERPPAWKALLDAFRRGG